MSAFPPMDYTRFKWRKASYDPSKYVREIAAGEAVNELANHNHGELVLYIGATVDSHVPLPPAPTLKAYARDAWVRIRQQIPTLAAHMEYDAAGTPLMSYRAPADEAEVDAWLDRTVHVKQDITDLDALRTQLSQEPAPDEHGDMTWIYLLRKSDSSFGLLLFTSHVTFDGSAGKILINLFLRQLVDRIKGVAAHALKPWGGEIDLLCPCTTEILGEGEVRQGDPRYDQTLGEILTELGQALPKNHGLRVRSLGPGPTARMGHTFTATESERILSRIKQKGYTPNHAVQAALTLLTLRDNPPPAASDAVIAYYGLSNARARLAPPYNTREGYPGYCLAMSVLQVPVSANGPDDAQTVRKIADVLKANYLKQKAYPGFLAVVPQEVDLMLGSVKQAIKSGGPLPPPWTAPWYLGDGIGEQYLDPQHVDSAGNIVFDIPDCFVSVNKTDPAPCFRCFSWRGRLVLSFDYNAKAMPTADMEAIMKEWIRLLLILVDQ